MKVPKSAILAAILIAPLAMGQAPTDAWLPLDTDPSGDVTTPAGNRPEFQATDLKSIQYQETPAALWLQITTAGFPQTAGVESTQASYTIGFAAGNQSYRLLTTRTVPIQGGAPAYDVTFEAYDAALGDYRRKSAPIEFQADETGILYYGLPWQNITTERGLPLVPGNQLTDISIRTASGYDAIIASSAGAAGPTPTAIAQDRMPDQGELAITLQSIGRAAEGIIATSPNPLRSSNGAPTTFLFPLVLSNFQGSQAVLELLATDLPNGWEAHPLANPIILEDRQSVVTSIAVSTTGHHQHGTQQAFEVQVLQAGALQASIEYTVYYTETAQPSGHHPTLYLYTVERSRGNPVSDAGDTVSEEVQGFYYNDAFMTTAIDAAEDAQVPVTAGAVGTRHGWQIPLTPSLGLGLDFTDDASELVLPLELTRDGSISQVQLEAVVSVQRADGQLKLASGSLDVGTFASSQEVTIPIARLPGVDVVAYQPGQNMVLTVFADFVDQPNTGLDLNLMPGGRITLPLEEYQDVIPEGSLSSLSLSVEPRFQLVNPGSRVNYHMTVSGPAGAVVELDGLGVPEGWRLSFSKNRPTLTEGPVLVTVQLEAPIGARDGDGASFFVRASPSDGSAATAAGIRAEVDSRAELPQIDALTAREKQSSSVAAVALLLMLATTTWTRRGRQ